MFDFGSTIFMQLSRILLVVFLWSNKFKCLVGN